MTNSLIQYITTFETTKNLPMVLALGHGESADLVASFVDEGVAVNIAGYTPRAIYQPESKWGTSEWFECPCEIVGNTAVAHWGNTYDNGDDAVKLFMHLSKNGEVAYPAIYKIGLFSTPGFCPSAIEPIPETIDFAQYQLENAPWVETDDYESDITGIRNSITSLDGASVKSIEYTGNNKFIVKQFLQANPNAVVIWKATGLDDMTQNIFRRTGIDGEYWTYECFDASTNQWAWFKLYTDWEISLDFILHKSELATMDEVDSKTSYTRQIVQTTADNIFYLDDIRSRYVYGIVPNASNESIGFNNYLTETGKVFDCYIDIDNTTGHSLEIIFGQTSWLYVVDSGVNLNNVKTIPSGTKRRFHISETGIQDTESTNYPVLHVSYTDLVGVG